MTRGSDQALLLTPGPVSVSATTKAVMLVDRPSGDAEFQAALAYTRDYLVGLVNGRGSYTAIPVPGSATYANEASIALLVPPGRKLLVHTNGVFGDRLIEICDALGTGVAVLRTDPFTPPSPKQFRAAMLADPAISHVMVVHCETSTDAAAAPIVATFHNPDDPAFSFDRLYEGMRRRGFVIFPGRLALADTFRIGCMGAVVEQDIAEAMAAVAEVMHEMGVSGVGRSVAQA